MKNNSTETDQQVQALYAELALHPEKKFGWGKGKANARALGYDPTWLTRLPAAVWESSAAVGNPFAIGPMPRGATVVDRGCGAGADACVAALLVGPCGRVIGVDVTPAMVAKARANAALAGFANVEILQADISDFPVADACADIVLSNGAINLSAHKPCVLKEAFRVLKPEGRLQIADMVRDPASIANACGETQDGSWANCVAGTLAPACFVEMLAEAGFANAEFLHTTNYRTSPETVGATFLARKPSGGQ